MHPFGTTAGVIRVNNVRFFTLIFSKTTKPEYLIFKYPGPDPTVVISEEDSE